MELWRERLAAECRKTPQAKVAAATGYSAAVVSTVLAGMYKSDLTAVQKAVEGAPSWARKSNAPCSARSPAIDVSTFRRCRSRQPIHNASRCSRNAATVARIAVSPKRCFSRRLIIRRANGVGAAVCLYFSPGRVHVYTYLTVLWR